MTSQFTAELRIPKERIAVLIGTSGSIKKQIESNTKTSIKIDSSEGFVFINGDDALNIYSAKEMIRAIARGFNPEIANLLLKQDFGFELLEIKDFIKSKNDLKRLKGRIIGKDGKSRRVIEDLTESCISVYGKTVGIIGEIETLFLARKAIEMLLKGSTHANVYKWLERQRSKLRRKEFTEL